MVRELPVTGIATLHGRRFLGEARSTGMLIRLMRDPGRVVPIGPLKRPGSHLEDT